MTSSDNQKKIIGLRIKDARSSLGLTQKEFCEKSGMKLPSLRDYELGNHIPGGDAVSDLARMGINANWLLTGDGPMFISQLITEAIDDLHDYQSLRRILDDIQSGKRAISNEITHVPQGFEGFVLVPRYDVAASMGNGAVIHSEQVVDHLAFREAWVRTELGANPKNRNLHCAAVMSQMPRKSC